MNLKNIFALVLVALSATAIQAQTNLPRTTISGHEFYYYQVENNESIYDIAAKLGVTKDEIIKNNPDASDGIQNGMRLYFPVDKNDVSITQVPSDNDIHVVKDMD